jgi:hypothetical protein
VRAGMTERNASLERHLVTIQTLPNTAWRVAPTPNERGLSLLTISEHEVMTKKLMLVILRVLFLNRAGWCCCIFL